MTVLPWEMGNANPTFGKWIKPIWILCKLPMEVLTPVSGYAPWSN